jgi:hypothetical protein
LEVEVVVMGVVVALMLIDVMAIEIVDMCQTSLKTDVTVVAAVHQTDTKSQLFGQARYKDPLPHDLTKLLSGSECATQTGRT